MEYVIVAASHCSLTEKNGQKFLASVATLKIWRNLSDTWKRMNGGRDFILALNLGRCMKRVFMVFYVQKLLSLLNNRDRRNNNKKKKVSRSEDCPALPWKTEWYIQNGSLCKLTFFSQMRKMI